MLSKYTKSYSSKRISSLFCLLMELQITTIQILIEYNLQNITKMISPPLSTLEYLYNSKEMNEGKEQKKLKTKKSQNKDNSGMNRTTRRKAPKNIAQLEEILKTSIIKQFTLLNKDTVNPTQLKTILLSIGFATHDVRKAIAKSATNSIAEFSVYDVFKLAIQLPHRDLWKKECFQIFSNKKQMIEVQDLESALKSVEGSKKSTLNWEKIMKYQGFELPTLSQADFAKLLAASNTFCE